MISGGILQDRQTGGGDDASPTAMPIDPPMKSKSKTATTTGMPSIWPWATAMASSSCVRLALRLAQAIGVALAVAELQRIARHLGQLDAGVVALVEQRLEALHGAQPHVMVAVRADPQVGFEVAVEDHLAAGRAFVPEVFRHLGLRVTSARSFGRTKLVSQFMSPSRPPAASSCTKPSTSSTSPASACPVRCHFCAQCGSTSAEPTTAASAAARWRARLRRRLDAEADGDRQVGMAAQAVDGLARLPLPTRGAGDADDRDVIDEAAGVRQHDGQTVVVGGRCRQADEVEAGGERGQAQLDVLFRRQIDDDQSVDAGGDRVLEEAVDAIAVDRVVVAHQHDRRFGVAFAEVADDAERSFERRPFRSARWDEAWIAGPSAIGSENGMPSSIRSAPAAGNPRIRRFDVSGSGSPAVTKVTRPPRPAAREGRERVHAMRVLIVSSQARRPR